MLPTDASVVLLFFQEEGLGFRVSVDAPFPPSLYVGPLEFRNGGGLPTLRHTKDDGSWRLHPRWTEAFDPDHDKARIEYIPKYIIYMCVCRRMRPIFLR